MSGVLNLLLAGAASAIKDAYYNLTTLLLNTSSTNGAQNNTFLDSSTNNFTITRNGNTTQGTFTPFSQTGWSNYFGSSNFLTTPSSSAFNLSSGDWTIEGWLWLDSNSDDTRFFTVVNSSTDMYGAYVRSGVVRLGQIGVGEASFGTVNLNTWNHIAFSKTSTSTITCYINGASTGTTTSYTLPNANCTIYIAASPANYALASTNGYISNFRVVKGTAVYTSNFTPSTTPLTAITNTQLLTCQSNRFLDNSTNAFAITTSGTPSVQAFSPFAPTAAYSTSVVGGSGYFDGTTDYLSFVDSANDLDLGGRVASIEAWVYPIATSGVQHFIFKSGGGTDWNTSNGVHYAIAFDTNKFYFVYNVSGGATFINGATTRSTRQWYHVVIATDASNNIALFVNGVRDGTATNAITKPTTRTSVYIGTNNSGTEGITGYISGERFIAGTGAYDPTQTTITVPTSAPTAVTNTKLLLNYTNAGIYDSTAKNVLETVGNAQVSTTQAKWGTTSMYFDGTGDYLPIPAGYNLGFGTGDFTIEGWLYLNATSSYSTIMSNRPNGSDTTTGRWSVAVRSSAFEFYANGSQIVSAGTVSTSTWTHFAVTRASGSIRLFLGGTQVGSTTSFTTDLSSLATWVGANGAGTEQINAYIDDLRVTKGYARYTANFTPPAAAFPLQ